MNFKKRTYQNFITQNLRHGKVYYISKKKKLLKQSQKEVIYEYILGFAGWWSILWVVGNIFWLMVDGGGWRWIYFGWWWMVVCGGGYILAGDGWWWMVVSGGGYILACDGWWWMVVSGGGYILVGDGWWHSLV